MLLWKCETTVTLCLILTRTRHFLSTGGRSVWRHHLGQQIHGEGRQWNALQSGQRHQIPPQSQHSAQRHQTRKPAGEFAPSGIYACPYSTRSLHVTCTVWPPFWTNGEWKSFTEQRWLIPAALTPAAQRFPPPSSCQPLHCLLILWLLFSIPSFALSPALVRSSEELLVRTRPVRYLFTCSDFRNISVQR